MTREDASLTSLLGEVIHKLGGASSEAVKKDVPSNSASTATSDNGVDDKSKKSAPRESTQSATVTPAGEIKRDMADPDPTPIAARSNHGSDIGYGSSLDGPRIFEDEEESARHHRRDPIFA